MTSSSKAKRTGRFIANIVAILICIILVPLLLVNLTMIVKSFTKPDEIPNFMGYMPIIVLSGSMEPEFYPGDLAIVKQIDTATVEAGDIITFHEGDSLVTHRVKEIILEDGNKRYITKGDNNNIEDRIKVTDDDIEGVYINKIANLGNVAMFLQTPIGMLIFIAIPIIVFILYDIIRRRHYDRREKNRTKELEEELAKMKQKLVDENSSQQTDMTT